DTEAERQGHGDPARTPLECEQPNPRPYHMPGRSRCGSTVLAVVSVLVGVIVQPAAAQRLPRVLLRDGTVPQGFAAFGRVIGSSVVHRIQAAPADGQRLAPFVRITQAKRVP